MMADLAEDAVSLTSSCEIVDALEDAVNDVSTPVNVSKEPSPAVELSWMAGAESSMTASQYAQVVFDDIKDSYPMDLDLVVSYTLTSFIQPGHGDRVCLYKLPYLQPHEYVAYVWSKVNSEKTLTVKFPVSTLPKEEDFYQFQYLKGDNAVAGASVPFQLRLPGSSHQEVTGVKEEDDLMVVQTPASSLQEKYSSLLDLSEKLTEELNKKNESFIVLERKNQSFVQSLQKYNDMEADLQILVRDKLQLEQTLTQTTETLNTTERVLNTTTDRLETVEKALKEKLSVIEDLEANLASYETKVGGYSSDVQLLTQERDSLATMLDQEIKARETLMDEKMKLVERLEDSTNMLTAATNSKDLAVAEIRTQIEQQDKLRQEMARMREDTGHLEAELVMAKQQLTKFTEHEDDSYVVTTVLSSMGEKLEAKELELKQKNEEISLLKQLENSRNEIEIHEKCLEDADTRATDLEKKNKELSDENKDLKERNVQLEKSNQELTARLEAGAVHYKRLAAEKKQLETGSGQGSEAYLAKIDSLEAKIVELTQELRQAQLSQDLKLSEIRSAVSSNNSLVGDSNREERHVSLDTCSDTSNMDSVRIDSAVRSSMTDPRPAVQMPGLFNPILHKPQPPPHQPQPPVPLQAPLVPENVDPTSSIPELTPRQSSPYSVVFSNSNPSSSFFIAQQRGEDRLLLCPMCPMTFAHDQVDEIQQHVNEHIDQDYKNCPMCNKKFDKDTPQKHFEEHVQEHFKDQQQSLSIRGWDLGID